MKILVTVFALLASVAAKADGFKCVDSTGQFAVKVYDNVQPSLGTRSPAVMVISDAFHGEGTKTLVTLTPDANRLRLEGGYYAADLNLPVGYSDALHGVAMGQVKEVDFSIDHNFSQPLAEGQKVSARMILLAKNSSEVYGYYSCIRYLKN